jgi:cellulose synthase/poly-beta-1,6-N-acetylglucosamine synthase-like glycosyltransferase
MTRIDAVIPVGADRSLLSGCLECLAAQSRSADTVIVVDDSPAGGLELGDAFNVLRSGARGPYAARNLGWRAGDADIVLFLDVRSRPRPDWILRFGEAFDEPAVALVTSDVRVRSGPSLAERVAQRHGFFQRDRYEREDAFRPYAPTCNLGVRRTALEDVNGFREIRSTADMDLCWRILDDPARRFEMLPEVLMEWVPRARVRDYLEQCYRYGKAHHDIRAEWADSGIPSREPLGYPTILRRIARRTAEAGWAGLVRRDSEGAVDNVRSIGRYAFELGYRRADGAAG